ncbi:hypothetical protein N0V88_007121 [Collariella sp. IMI 366227]|nr:hypothetical protein N0V88_007121 [Collariella sp. IMI 366227]
MLSERPAKIAGVQLGRFIMGFTSGEAVRIRGSTVVYKVVAVNGSLVTIIVSNPQPDGSYLPFTPTALQTVDESRLERAEDVS